MAIVRMKRMKDACGSLGIAANVRHVVTVGTLLLFCGCASLPERMPVPVRLVDEARIPGIPDARSWGDDWPKEFLDQFETASEAELQLEYPAVYGQPESYLAISGGGANGAFGAGFLVGWTAAGTRPEFTMVTGISTGALTAPFAFLGPAYDDFLRAAYTTTRTKDIAIKRSFIAGLFSDALADTRPLRARIEKYVTPEVIDAIAREYRRGRRLWIGTANLDSGRPVIWNLGAIAASSYPDRVKLIHDVLQASSAIPVAFPPVLISVQANGQRYDEMHVDGGAASQVFVYPAQIDWPQVVARLKAVGRPQVYVIRNAFLEADFNGVKPKVIPIASRAIASLIRTQGIGDLYQIHALCGRDGNDFNLAYIPADFSEEPKEAIDPVYMGKLFERGYQMAANGYPWYHEPPGYHSHSVPGVGATANISR
jgi:predicted patatin/cPLA2 family phospholipase